MISLILNGVCYSFDNYFRTGVSRAYPGVCPPGPSVLKAMDKYQFDMRCFGLQLAGLTQGVRPDPHIGGFEWGPGPPHLCLAISVYANVFYGYVTDCHNPFIMCNLLRNIHCKFSFLYQYLKGNASGAPYVICVR